MTKHDEIFKYLLSKKDDVAELIQKTLPADLSDRIDFSTLELEATDTVNEQLKELVSDVIYKVDYTGEEFRTSISVALLFEHKSEVPRHPHLQLLRYMLRIWELNLDQKKPLRVVIPIIVYNGEKAWEYKTLFENLFESVSLRMLTAVMNQIHDEEKLRESSPEIAKL